jgi:UDP-N-acetylglucosamine--N-acetylmuramyl-(pentapeptide) pyrophosphoryl-undecaprenol N-acetylglucosamine transferase
MKIKILAVGGGSGGHVTPVVAVLRELRAKDEKAELRFWCDRAFGNQAKSIVGNFDQSIPVQTIIAGKLRRYHHLSLLQHFLIPSVFWPNLRDIILVLIGTLQSIVKLIIWRPDVVFTKGGYVCLPVGWAARMLRIPLVIHDSDAHPGLTNRLLARHATAIATGAPLKYYSYPKAKSRYVGIPISSEFRPFSVAKRQQIKADLGFDTMRPLVVITGGGLGARRINDSVMLHLDALLKFTNVILISGADQFDELRALTPRDDPRFQLYDFVSKDMAQIMGAADAVIARAGATTILELAALAKPTILVPNGRLTGGHQLKNAKVYEDAEAAVVVTEDLSDANAPIEIVQPLHQILTNQSLQKKLAANIHAFARPRAAAEVADMILAAAKKR